MTELPHTPPVAPEKPGVRIRDIHGDHFDDPLDWLRDKEDPRVLAHLHAENTWADRICGPVRGLAERIAQEIRSHTRLDDVTVPVLQSGFWWYSRWREGAQYRTHHRLRADAHPGAEHCLPPTPLPGIPLDGEELVVDENTWADGEDFFRLVDLTPSPCGRFVAWARDISGDERWTWIVQDLTTGEVIDSSVHGAGYGIAWSADSSSFLYTRVDPAWRQHELWLHRVGTGTSEDLLLLAEPDEGFDLWFEPSADPDHVAVHSTSTTTGEAWLWFPAHPTLPPLPVTGRTSGVQISLEPAGDHLLLVHTADSPEGTLAAAALPHLPGTESPRRDMEPFAPPATWVSLRHAGPGERILHVEAHREVFALSMRSGSLTQVELRARVDQAGRAAESLDLIWGEGHFVELDSPVRTVSVVPGGPFEAPWVRICHQSITVPPTWEQVDARTGERTHLATLDVPGWDAGSFVEERLWVTARDGHTRIPVTLVRHLDTPVDGTAAGWLHGYGAYEISFDAEFDVLRLPALTRGVVHAIAHVRGGGEMGRAWYEDGKELVKEHSFTDFLDVAAHLVDSGHVAPDRLVAEGRSAGGLLVGACLNAEPERFRVVLAGVPFVDALTTILDPSLPLTAGEWEEWGNPIENPAVHAAMKAYTPYENVPDGARLPAVMATTSLNDTRVFFVEPAKWVQRLRAATTAGPVERPIVLRTEMVAGHGGRSGREGRWQARAEEFAFALSQVGVDEGGAGDPASLTPGPRSSPSTPISFTHDGRSCEEPRGDQGLDHS